MNDDEEKMFDEACHKREEAEEEAVKAKIKVDYQIWLQGYLDGVVLSQVSKNLDELYYLPLSLAKRLERNPEFDAVAYAHHLVDEATRRLNEGWGIIKYALFSQILTTTQYNKYALKLRNKEDAIESLAAITLSKISQ